MPTKGIFIVSLNSQRLKDAINNRSYFDFAENISDLDVFVFDNLEILNGIFFNDQHAGEQRRTIEDLITKLEREFLPNNTHERKLVRCSSIRKSLNPIISELYTEVYTNSSFERHCKNQIFKNLQPKLARMHVTNNRDMLLELLMPFLVVEIALYMMIYSSAQYTAIFGLEIEMEIVTAIKSGKYPNLTKFLKTDVNYIKLKTGTDA